MQEHYKTPKGLHLNYKVIVDHIEDGSKVLDLGCGSGELLKLLKNKGIKGRGIEIDSSNVIKCIEKGLSVCQGDIDEGLKEYQDNSYDYVVLNQTLQCTHKPDFVVDEMLRVGRQIVVSFPNFAYWRVRNELFFRGRMPKSNVLPFEWHDTPNIHLVTIKDFRDYCKQKNISILDEVHLRQGIIKNDIFHNLFANLLTEEAILFLSKPVK